MTQARTIAGGMALLLLPALALGGCAAGRDGGQGGFAVSPGRMPAFCAGDAARRFDTDLTQIATAAAVATADGHAVPGSFRLASGDSVEFLCTFDGAGRYTGIRGR